MAFCWKPFSSIWGERDYPDLYTKASEGPNVDYLVEKVKNCSRNIRGQCLSLALKICNNSI